MKLLKTSLKDEEYPPAAQPSLRSGVFLLHAGALEATRRSIFILVGSRTGRGHSERGRVPVSTSQGTLSHPLGRRGVKEGAA